MDLEVAKRQLLEDGCCVVPGILTPQETETVRAKLWQAAENNERAGVPTRQIGLDPDPSRPTVLVMSGGFGWGPVSLTNVRLTMDKQANAGQAPAGR